MITNSESIIQVGCKTLLHLQDISSSLKLQCLHILCWKKRKNQIKTGEKSITSGLVPLREDLEMNTRLEYNLDTQTISANTSELIWVV